MTIINLNNLNFNNESSRLSSKRIFGYKNEHFTDKNKHFYNKINLHQINEIVKEYPDQVILDTVSGLNNEYFYGLMKPDAFQTANEMSTIKEIQNTTRYNNVFSTVTKSDPLSITKKLLSDPLANCNYIEASRPLIDSIYTQHKFDGEVIPEEVLLNQYREQRNNEIDTRYFGVKRLQHELKPFSRILQKKQIIKKLYKSNLVMSDAKNSNDFNYGFSNYNCLNFFNLELSKKILDSQLVSNEDKNKILENTHSNCLIYSNKKINNKNIFPNQKGELTISFWINPKRLPKKDYYYNPGCIINIPNIISVYLMENEDLRSDEASSFYILAQLGEYSNTLKPRIINEDRTFVTTNYLNQNYWYNVTVNLFSNKISFVINDIIEEYYYNTKLVFANNYESIFTIGNRLNLNNSDFQYEWKDVTNLRRHFFNQHKFKTKALNINEILFDSTLTDEDIDALNLLNTKLYPFTESDIINKEDESFALNAEIQGLVIFNDDLNKNVLSNFMKGTDSTLLNSDSISFYLPCLYLTIPTIKESYITLGEKSIIDYYAFVNPVFSNKVNGHEVLIENFVIDTVSLRRPYILGMSSGLIQDCITKIDETIEDTQESEYLLTKKRNLIIDLVKYHKNANQLYNKIFTSELLFLDPLVNQNIDNLIKNNLIYRNNFILPCDNGLNKFSIDTNYIKNKLNNITLSYTNYNFYNEFYYENDVMRVNCNSNIVNPSSINFKRNIKNIGKTFFSNAFVIDSIVNDIDQPLPPLNVGTGILYKNNSISKTDKKYDTYFSDILLDETNMNHINNNCFNLDDKTMYDLYFQKMKSITSVPQINRKLIINSIFKNIDDITYENNRRRIIIEGRKIERLVNGQIVTLPNSFQFFVKDYYLSLQEIEGYTGETHSVIFDISNKLYSSRIRKESVQISDYDISGTGGACSINLKDDGKGLMYRADCLSPHAKWNYVGHIFYRDGLVNILHPGLSSFGENNFVFELKGDHKLFTYEINVPVQKGELNKSVNKTFKKLRPSDGLYDIDEEDFVYITGVNLHDENLNIVAKANFAQPIVKRQSDRYNIRLKMDY